MIGELMDRTGVNGWLAALPDLILRIGTPEFMPALDARLSRVARFDLSCVFAYPMGEGARLLHDGLGPLSDPDIMRRYLQGGYLLDCVYTACKHATPAGLYRLRELAPDAFFEGEYYNSPDIHPCISLESGSLAEEIVFLVPLAGGFHAAYSLLRSSGGPVFSGAEMAALRQTEPHVRALVARHWAELAPAKDARPPGGRLEDAFAAFAADRLTDRERLIVSLVLQGHSSHSIGLRLGIAEGTVKNHRKHIHAKLGISSQAQLFALFVDHIGR
jgi:DNA-binding CsgD family transcriptional regulator